MTRALDADLPGLYGEWAVFWRDMRALYVRTSFYLATGAKAGDAACVVTGRALWQQIEERLATAGDRLESLDLDAG